MEKTQIFKTSFEVSNDFNNDACINAIKNQLSDSAFKELINGEKNSLTLDFIISVNEEEEHELDREKLEALKFINQFKKMTKDQIENPKTFDLFSLWIEARDIDTSVLDKHGINS